MMPVPIKDAKGFFPECPAQNAIFSKRVEAMAQTVAEFQLEQLAFTDKMRLIFKLKNEEANIAGLAELYDVVNCDLNMNR